MMKKPAAKEREKYEGIYLIERYMIILILPVLLFTASLSLGQEIHSAQNNTSLVEENLKYIWSITGVEKDQITISLNQDGNFLFGQAKYEPEGGEPWNGEVGGSISGKYVHLVITALKDNKQVSTTLEGIIAGDTISGEFFQASEGKTSDRGEFNAIWINPDLSSYTPAKIVKPKPETPSQAANITAPADTDQMSQPVTSKKSMYHDVHEDADRILTGVGDISQIPIGMGGSGLA